MINPKSGYGSEHHALTELRAAARAAGIHLVEHVTTRAGDATEYVAGITDSAGAVIVWGGDGTANEVARGLAGAGVPMLPCPAGTENLLAKELRIPSNPRSILSVLLHGHVRECDIGRVNGGNFLIIIGVGFDGEVVRRVTAGRSGHISHLSYFWPIWRTFWEHDFPHMRIVADGEEVFNDYGLAFVGNISRYAVGLRICRDAVPDDGLLDLVVFSCREQTALMLHAAWTLLRRHPLKGNVIYHQARDIRIETDSPVPTQVDGDIGPNTPLDIAVEAHRIPLIFPHRPAADWPWAWGDFRL